MIISRAYVTLAKVIFEDCKLFRDVAQYGSLSRAAQLNGISQSAATQHVQELERRLGTILLDRSTRPMTLTHAGKAYADLCRDVLRREEEFLLSLGQVEETLRVASIYSIGLTEMNRLREALERNLPGAHLQVEYLRPDKVYQAVLEDQADLGFVSYPQHRRELTILPWRDEPMAVAAHPQHRFAGQQTLGVRDLNREAFVAFDEDLAIRRELDRHLRNRGVEVNVVAQFDNIQSIKEAVALGTGISILPEQTMRAEVRSRRLVAIELDSPELVRPVGIIYRRRKVFSKVGREFLELVMEAGALAGV